MKTAILAPKQGVVTKFGAITCLLLLAACGGGDDDPAAVSASTPAPGAATSTPAPGAAPTPIAPGPVGASPAAGQPPAAGGSPPAGGAPGEIVQAPVPSVSTLPGGVATGGATDKSTSGYADALLTGRWTFQPAGSGLDDCVSIPATAVCAQPFSLRSQLGYTASGLAATRINEISYFDAVGCQPANQLGTLRMASDIQFDAADTMITDQSDFTAPGTIAVRRGVVTAERFDATSLANMQSLFADCAAADPTAPQDPEETCSPEVVALRIESSAEGPVLITQEDFQCQPGATPPPTVPITVWNSQRESGAVKAP